MASSPLRRQARVRVYIGAAVLITAVGVGSRLLWTTPWGESLLAALADDTRPGVAAVWTRWDGVASPAWCLRTLLGLLLPALAWGVAVAAVFPRAAVRLAGIMAHRASLYVALGIAGVGVWFVAARVLGDRALDMDESSFVFQSKVLRAGRLAAPALAGDEDGDRAFVRAKTEVVRDGRWFSIYPPLHPLLLAGGRLVGWPKLAPWLCGLALVYLTYDLTRRWYGDLAASVAALGVAASPFFIVIQGSYLSEASFLFFVALTLWGAERALTRGGWAGPALVAVGAGGSFLTREYHAAACFLPVALAYFTRRENAARPRRWGAAAVIAAASLAAWAGYNLLQTGYLFLPPRALSGIKHIGFDGVYSWANAAGALGRNLFALASDGFGWPLISWLPVVLRPFLRPKPSRVTVMLYGVALAVGVANVFVRNAGIVYGPRYYYAAWWAMAFITADFIVILGRNVRGRVAAAGEGLGVALLTAAAAVGTAAYVPKAVERYQGRPWGEYALWANDEVKRAVEALRITNAVVVLAPRDWCLSSYPGSPFLDDDVIFVRDVPERRGELLRLFPGREIYYWDYREAGGPKGER